MMKFDPFAHSNQERPPARPLEHLHLMEDVKQYLNDKVDIDLIPQIRKLDASIREHPEQTPERINLNLKRGALMERARALREAAKKCQDYQCNPWQFEHVIFDDVQNEFSKPQPDMKHINHLRGLLRGGTWFAFDRTSKGVEVRNVTTEEQALPLISKARMAETEYWDWQIHLSDPQHKLPEISGELEEYKEEALRELDVAEQAIRDHLLGEALEPAVRSIEHLHGKILGLYQKAATKKPDGKPLNPDLANQWRDLFVQLRPLRNFLYYRRLYPVQAKQSLPSVKLRRVV